MKQKTPKSAKPANAALMRAIYLAIIIGIVAVFVIVMLESIVDIVNGAV